MNEWSKIKKKSLGEVPQEASENIQAPELAPSDKRITGRTEQLNLKVSREFKKKLKIIAAEEDCLTTEIMEKALECYDKQRKSEKTLGYEVCYYPGCYKEAIGTRTQSHLPNKEAGAFCSEHFEENSPKRLVISEKEKLTNQPLDEQFTDTCSFYLEKNEAVCDKPIFDKKKQLCRSHNRQVWKRFNAFLKGESIGSTAAWLGTWQESGDWKWFWDLEAEKGENENKN